MKNQHYGKKFYKMKSSNIIPMEIQGLFSVDKTLKSLRMGFQWKVDLIYIKSNIFGCLQAGRN